MRAETEVLQSEITKYTAVKDNIELYTTGIENATNSIADVLHKFPVTILEEDMIMLGREFEKKIDNKILLDYFCHFLYVLFGLCCEW